MSDGNDQKDTDNIVVCKWKTKKSDLKKNYERRRQTNAENRSRIDDEKTDVKKDTKTYTEGRKDEKKEKIRIKL